MAENTTVFKLQQAMNLIINEIGDPDWKGKQILMSGEMESAIAEWTNIYNNKPKWLNTDDGVTTMGVGGDIASELARLTTIEMQSSITGNESAEEIDGYYQKFLRGIRNYTEYGCAKGGCVFKPYYNGEGISIECIQADSFYPTVFDSSGNITGAVFAESFTRNKNVYTRVEWHEPIENGYRIINRAFESSDIAVLGNEISLKYIPEWQYIEEDVTLNDIKTPLFGYFKVPKANRRDNVSPLGVSVFADSVKNIKYADEQYSRILREYQITEPALFLDESMLKTKEDGSQVVPKGYERFYKLLQNNRGVNDQALFKEWAPSIRDQSLFNGLNKILQRIEFGCGLSYGTISDPNYVERTATEIVKSNQRMYSTVKDIQKALRSALEDTVKAMIIYADIYGIASVTDYDMTFNFDDSVIVDKETEQAIRLQEVNAGIVSPIEYIKWRYGVDDETAQSMMPQAQTSNTDFLGQFVAQMGEGNANT